jgi:spore maturation protein A
MNIVFFIIVMMSLIIITIVNPESAFAVMLDGAKSAIDLSFKLLAIYAVWLSVLKIIEKTGLDKKFSAMFSPVTKFLFKGENEKTRALISMNMAANMLGMGGAATPLGIRAMEMMDNGSGKATDNMIMLMVISASSIQLIPATIMALRSANGSASPSDIFLPSLIATTVTTGLGIFLVKLFSRK